MNYDVIIVGGASAGLTSAIYLSRFKLKTLMITKDMGGQTLLASKIENYPGFMSISGIELIQKFEEQFLEKVLLASRTSKNPIYL
ncbi:MAG: FAD-dependent oxidoreductase [archaeon]|nr:FAD-dependent oxidoreductase [archaeon]MCP8321350.1 FAD-dependent oxidoreductase [archaeon]